ncbi:LmeA family phospholipid-binding protein [Actinacidiphila acidipaludis]|uniref:DUF2993 domain-containing protein n=1 Tax=Actinacidiphila acidipaludis TaxID=2873382 RepID=A0ABS7QCS7_9ACTN|nr:DUF2993 domain-containing protein [Streptomyces acidipaludis]MBY8880956.1 DUF2993 domain-containing protein [Streptomyces acidipaludis]
MRVARILLIVVVVLGGLFVAADRIAVTVAQNKAAQRAQATENLTEKPKVSITGFPFLTQVLSGKLDDVKVSADDIAAGDGSQSVRIDSFHADLYGVKLSNGFSRAIADSADGQAFITYADLSKAAPAGIKVSYAGPSASGTPRVKLTGSFMGAHLSVLSDIVLKKDTIGLHAQGLPKELTALGLEGKVRDEIDFTSQVTHLPANLELTSVTTTPDGISVRVGGKDIVLAN